MIRVFTPQTRDVKASVERLIQKEMLVREEKDKNTIKYKHWYIYMSVYCIHGYIIVCNIKSSWKYKQKREYYIYIMDINP